MHPGTSLTDAMRQWPTPIVSDDKRGDRERDGQRGIGLTQVARESQWPTPTERDYKGSSIDPQRSDGKSRLSHLDSAVQHWPPPMWATPRAEDGESCGNHPGAEDSLTGQSRSFRPGQAMSTRGGESSHDVQTSHPLWITPHGFANTDRTGRTAGAGGEFQKQALSASETWSTPRAECNVQNPKNLPPPSAGGRSSKPGLQDQIAPFTSRAGANSEASASIPTSATQLTFVSLLAQDASVPTDGDGTMTPANSSPMPKLNAQFVEWLMGLPIGWTGFERAETEWSRWQSRMRFALSQLAPVSCDDERALVADEGR